jgi:hypothetical protein
MEGDGAEPGGKISRAVSSHVNREHIKDEADYPITQCVNLGVDFLKRNHTADNWLLQLELFDPHEPFTTPQHYRDNFQTDYDGPVLDWPLYDRLDLTTNEAADTWFNGYNAGVATTVWVGFSDYRPLGPREYGSTTPLPIWIDYMREALSDIAEIALEQPESVVSLKIDPDTGLVARPGQRNALFEYFLEDFQPERPIDESPTLYDSEVGNETINTTDLF